MNNIVIRWIVNAMALLVVAYLVPGIEISGIYIALIVAFILGFLNAVVRPVLLILTFPITVITLGLFIFFLNGLMFLFIASFVEGFYVNNILSAISGSFILSVISWIGNKMMSDEN